jgi:hypothetical protein
MNSPAGLPLPRALRDIIRGGGGDCEVVGKVTLYVLRIVGWADKERDVEEEERKKERKGRELTYFVVLVTSGLWSCGGCS